MSFLPSVNLWGDLSTGLIARYPFDGNASDMSGSGNHATVYGPVISGADRLGQAKSRLMSSTGSMIIFCFPIMPPP